MQLKSMKLKAKKRQGSASTVEAEVFVLKNRKGITVQITNYGGIIMSVKVPDRKGVFENIVLGFDTVVEYCSKGYLVENPYLGAIVGRNANVISNAVFYIDHIPYRLQKNFGEHNLHGGVKGFDKVIWNVDDYDERMLKLSYDSHDGEEGFPGNLHVQVIYALTDDNELSIQYLATTDKKTLVNLTNHSYFNLKGEGKGDILDHELFINAGSYVEFNEQLVPTGKIKKAENTPMDFRKPSLSGSFIGYDYDQLRYGEGYDVTYLLDDTSSLKAAAALYHKNTGRFIEVFTTLPGIHLYTGNSLNENIKPGYFPRAGLCLETQYLPDALNQKGFSSGLLAAGELYDHTTVYRFSIR